MSTKINHPELKRVIKQILQYNPGLEEFYYTDKTLAEYTKEKSSHYFHPEHIKRQERYKYYIQKKVDQLFNQEEKQRIRLPFDGGIVTSTADHHGIHNHPVILGCNLVTPFNRLFKRESSSLVLACANVPLGEVLHRRGFDFHGRHLNLFAKSEKNVLVLAREKFDFDFEKALRRSKDWYRLNSDEQTFFIQLTRSIQNIDFSTCNNLSDQLTKVLFHTWPLLFSAELRSNLISLINLGHDHILSEYLQEFCAQETGSFFYKILFNKKLRQAALKHFSNIYGAWFEEQDKGTHFFWGISPEGKSVRLELKDGHLVSTSNELILNIRFEPQSIIKALQSRMITPNIFVKFGIIVFYMGIFAQGGIGQTSYTTEIRGLWEKFLTEHFPEELTLFKTIDTFGLNSLGISYTRGEDGKIRGYSGMDILYDGGFSKTYMDTISKMSLKDLLLPVIDISYYRLVPERERVPYNIPNKVLFEGWQWLK